MEQLKGRTLPSLGGTKVASHCMSAGAVHQTNDSFGASISLAAWHHILCTPVLMFLSRSYLITLEISSPVTGDHGVSASKLDMLACAKDLEGTGLNPACRRRLSPGARYKSRCNTSTHWLPASTLISLLRGFCTDLRLLMIGSKLLISALPVFAKNF